MWWTAIPITLAVLIFVGAIVLIIYCVHKSKVWTEEKIKRLPDIDYTQIIGSGGGESGSVTMHGSAGTNFGSYSSRPTTKFLVVYLNGEQEIVSVDDNSKLCKEYLNRLKKAD